MGRATALLFIDAQLPFQRQASSTFRCRRSVGERVKPTTSQNVDGQSSQQHCGHGVGCVSPHPARQLRVRDRDNRERVVADDLVAVGIHADVAPCDVGEVVGECLICEVVVERLSTGVEVRRVV